VRSQLLCPRPLRERAARCCRVQEWVRGACSRATPLTHSNSWAHHCALSRKGRGHWRRAPRILAKRTQGPFRHPVVPAKAGPMITAGGYGSRLSARFRGRRPGRRWLGPSDDGLVQPEHQPAAVRNDCWVGFPVSGLLFTGTFATRTCWAAEGDMPPHMSPRCVTIRRHPKCHHPSS
jgi:hypothetical protein